MVLIFLTKRKISFFFVFFLLLALTFSPGCGRECEKAKPDIPSQSKFNWTLLSQNKLKEKELTLAIFGDNRPASPVSSQPEAFKKILAQIKKTNPDVVISTGDSVYGSVDSFTYEKQYQEFASLLKKTRLPFLVALGNHDAKNEVGISLYRKYLHPETYFALKIKGCLLIILDTESEEGRVNKKQLNWLKETLKKSHSSNIFVFLHRPPFSIMNPKAENGKHLSFLDLKNRDELVSILKRSGVKTVFSGHEHFFNLKNFSGLTQIITGCAGAPPYADFAHGGFPHFVLVKVKEKSFKIRVIDENGSSYPPEKFKTPVFP